MANAVIVVDLQNGFMHPKGTLYCGDEARRIIPCIQARATQEREAGATVFFTQDSHAPDDPEFRMFPPHCVAGTWEEEIVDELKALARTARCIRKRRYSALYETDLAEQLAALQPDRVLVMGDCTDICVLHTVADLRNRDWEVEVPAAGVASFDPAQHEWALGHMERILGARITRG
jgi:nicotinamidase-related amidase